MFPILSKEGYPLWCVHGDANVVVLPEPSGKTSSMASEASIEIKTLRNARWKVPRKDPKAPWTSAAYLGSFQAQGPFLSATYGLPGPDGWFCVPIVVDDGTPLPDGVKEFSSTQTNGAIMMIGTEDPALIPPFVKLVKCGHKRSAPTKRRLDVTFSLETILKEIDTLKKGVETLIKDLQEEGDSEESQ